MRRALTQRPALGVLFGAVTIAFSGILFRTSHVSPTTGAFFRCFWALPVLWPLAVWEDRRIGARPWTLRRAAWIGGVFFAADLVLWHYSIEYVGAGLATVLGNTQVVLVGLLAWAIFRERPSRNSLLAIPVAMVGIVLISGVLESGHTGATPSSARSTACSPGSRTPGSCSRCAGDPGSGAGLPARSTTPRSRARSASSRSASSSATWTSRPARSPGLADHARAQLAGDRWS